MHTLAFGLALALALKPGGASHAGAGEPRSVYTEISQPDCTLLPASGEPGDEEDGLRCQGPAGWQLRALSGDLRASVTLVPPRGKELPLDFWNVVTHGFSTLGPRAEWRVRDIDGQPVPHALVVRVFANEDPEHPERRTSYLAVAKITPSAACVSDRLTAGADDNARARAAADTAATRPCLDRGAL